MVTAITDSTQSDELLVLVHHLFQRTVTNKEWLACCKAYAFRESDQHRNGHLVVRTWRMPVQEGRPWVAFTATYLGKQPFAISVRVIGAGKGDCDPALTRLANQLKEEGKLVGKETALPCAYDFEDLDSGERQRISAAVGDTLTEVACSQYLSALTFWELGDKRFRFDDDSRLVAHFYDPALVFLPKLFRQGAFSSFAPLMTTRNRYFNWLVAEAAYYFHQSVPFLTEAQMAVVRTFDGKGGLPRFRSRATLDRVYGPY